MRSYQFIIENTQQYDPSKKYYGSIPEIKYLPLSVIKRRELDFRPEVMTVSDEVAKNMDYSEPILVTVFRFDNQDDDTTPEVTLEDGHHRMAAAIQTGRKYLPVIAKAVNAKGEKINALLQLSKQIEDGAARSATPQVSEEAEHDYKANAIFLARSNSCPKMWSYDHVGFLLPNGQQVQMSGHKQSDGVYVTNKVTDDPAFPEQQIKTMKLKKTIIVPSTNTVDAENCGTFVSNVLKQNGIIMTIQSLYALFKQPRPHVTESEGEPEGVKHISKELLQHIVKQVGTEGAHAIVKSLEWGDGAAKELLQLIVKDLKKNIRVAESTNQRLGPNPERSDATIKCPHCGGKLISESLISEVKDACYYKVKSRYKVWPSAYASGALVKCRKKGAKNWGKKTEDVDINLTHLVDELTEDLHKWFKEKWVRFGPDGKIKGDCARASGKEGKPKCLPQSKAHSLGKKGRASAASRKRREDPNPERSGSAINVATKKKTNNVAEQLKQQGVAEEWSKKYKKSINCSHPKGFSQKAHCAGKKKQNESVDLEMTCTECGMCQTHGNLSLSEVKQRLDTKCWKGKHKEGTTIKGGIRVNKCVPNKKVNEDSTADLESEFIEAYYEDPMGVFKNVKDNFLHVISQLKPINHWAADLNKKITTMSKDDFARLVMNEIFPRLKAANWPKPWGEEMANVFLDYKTEKLQIV